MGFMSPKKPNPTPIPTGGDPATAQITATEKEVDATVRKRKATKEGKSSLTVEPKKDTASLNTGSTTATKETSASTSVSTGGA